MNLSEDRETFTTNHAISGFSITIVLSFITLLLILYDRNILHRFSAFTPGLKSNPYILAWLVVAFLVILFVSLGYVVLQILDEVNILRDFIWYLFIHLGSLLLATLAYLVLNKFVKNNIVLLFIPSVIGNLISPPLAYFYYITHFRERYHLVPLTAGITVICLAYTWLYLFMMTNL